MNADPLFTILVPINRPPNLLPFAIASIQAQTEAAFEVFVVCDGAPAETVARAKEVATADRRFRVFDFEKGERHGEAHRDTALREARGMYVAQIADDDFWFPDYLAELGSLLAEVQFGNLIQVNLSPDDEFRVYAGQLSDGSVRAKMLKKSWNFFGPSFAGYHLASYRALPIGWSPAPDSLPTDLHMWRKFLQRNDVRVGTRFSVQGVKMSAFQRIDQTIEEREAEHRRRTTEFSKPEVRRNFQAKALAALYAAQSITLRRKIAALRAQLANRPSAKDSGGANPD